MNGERPPHPHGVEPLGLSDPLWEMTESCWPQDPNERLGSSEVVDLLRETRDVRTPITITFPKKLGAHPATPSHRYVTSPRNPLFDVVNGTQGAAQPSSVTPQTNAALSPKLLDVLQYRRPTLEPILSDAGPLSNDGETIVADSVFGHPTTSQHSANGIEQPEVQA